MTPDYLRALQAAILAHPEAAALAITNDMPKVAAAEAAPRDAEVARLMREAGFGSGSHAVSCHLAKKLLIKRGKWRAIVQAAHNDRHPAVEAAYAAVALAEDARMDADFNDTAAAPLLAGLVAASLLDAADVAALSAMCKTDSTVTSADVSRALRGPWGDE